MIIAEAKKTKQNKTKKYELKDLTDGTHWFWTGTYYSLWGESQGLTNSKLHIMSI